jgi:phosphoribosylcarboxyaminoimidazole (NCAIR) mutase
MVGFGRLGMLPDPCAAIGRFPVLGVPFNLDAAAIGRDALV